MSEVCAKHVKTPAFIYGACIGCELEGLRAEAQALREEVERSEQHRNDQADLIVSLRTEVAALKHSQQVLIGSRNAHRDERDAARKEVAALRARVVVVPERLTNGDSISRMLREIGCDGDVSYHHAREIWNACLDGLARLNGKTVSEGLLRQLLDSDGIDGIFDAQQNYAAHQELRALLSEQDGGGQ